jgi:hypothetical protein
MLKMEIRSEIKEAIILLVFTGLMVETLTTVTVVLVFGGAIMVWLRKKPSKLVRNLVTLGLFAAYWISYGKVIDPEVGMNFLTSIVLIKLLEKETDRDQYMIFFGLILLVSAGSLFQRSLSYVLFFAFSFFILIQDLYKSLKLQSRITDILQSLVWVLPFTAFLFFFVPRMLNPFQIEKGTPKDGEVGYTPDVNISNLESLTFNDSPVFQASVESQIKTPDLYWRGNTLSFSDGWNWPLMPHDRFQKPFLPTTDQRDTSGIKQKIRVFAQQDFFFGFDHPYRFITSKGEVELSTIRSLAQNRWHPALRYEVISHNSGIVSPETINYEEFRTGLKPEEKVWIHKNFRSTALPELKKEIQKYFQRELFSYSLSPGRVENFLDFMQEKKIGFCSHYASSVAQILRAKKIPARLVSGFLGGSYNKFAGFYLVTQNDAHVWVEALHNGKWVRLDPTGWIAPDRIRLGGEAFMLQENPNILSPMKFLGKRFQFLNDWQQWFSQWDFKFYKMLEEMDYYGQEALLEKLQFKREWIFSFIPIMLALFMGLYVWHLTLKKVRITEHETLWKKFQAKVKKRGVHLTLHSLAEDEAILKSQDLIVQEVWNELVEVSFKSHTPTRLHDLHKKIRDL